VGTHRSHCHALLKGVSPREVIAEVLGKKTGCCGGKAGTLHLSKPSVNYMFSASVVGSSVPLGVGMAYALKYFLKKSNVVVVFVGDGAVNTGDFHEGLNLASIYKVPLLVIIENNQYAISMNVKKAVAIENLSLRSVGYGINGVTIDGMNPFEVYMKVKPIVDFVRNEGQPALVECRVYRFLGHHVGDVMQEYRSREEVEMWKKMDPLLIARDTLLRSGVVDVEDVNKLEHEVKKEVETAAEMALKDPYPELEEMYMNVW